MECFLHYWWLGMDIRSVWNGSTNMRPGNLMPKLPVQGTGDVWNLGMEREYGNSWSAMSGPKYHDSIAAKVIIYLYVCESIPTYDLWLYTYTHTHTYPPTYLHTHTCIHTDRHTDTQTYRHPCIHATCIPASMHPCIHASLHTCIHAYMHTCIHASIHPYIHG